jgi:hypothetical protein
LAYGSRSNRVSSSWPEPVLRIRIYRPIVFRYAGPEDPNGEDREDSEEHFKEAAINFAIGAVANVNGGNKLEDLANGEEKTSSG